jgi:hypothetical protein
MRLFILSILLCLSTLLFAQEKKWIEHKSEVSKISFKMPNELHVYNKENNGIKTTIFQAKDLTCMYGVVASFFGKQDFTHQPIDEIYKEMKEGSLLEDAAIFVSEQTCVYQRMLVKEMKYTTLHKGMEYTYYKRFIFRGSFIYQISISAATRHTQELEAQKEIYFNSFTFL